WRCSWVPLPQGQKADEVVGDMGGGDGGDLRVVVGGGHLDHVRADQVGAVQAAQDLQQLAAGEPARLGGAGARCVRRVEDVDVDGDVQRPVADALTQRVHHLVHTAPQHVGGGDDAEAEAPVVLQVLLAVQRAADADVRGRLGVGQPFPQGPAEGGAGGVRRVEVGVPGVGVGVEVEQRDRPV